MSTSSINPIHLRGLKQAFYVLDCLDEGDSRERIVAKFEGDEQLVRIWISFAKDNHWIEKDRLEQWHLTVKGREQSRGVKPNIDARLLSGAVR